MLAALAHFRAVSEHLLISCFPERTVQRDMSDFFLFASVTTPLRFFPKAFIGIMFEGSVRRNFRESVSRPPTAENSSSMTVIKKNQQSASLHHEEADRKHRRCLAASRRTSKRRRCVTGWTEFLSQRLGA